MAKTRVNPSNEFARYICEILNPLGELTLGRFFGGQSIKCQQKQFSMIMKGRLYFRVGPKNLDAFINQQSAPFSYSTKKGRVFVKSYYEVPSEIVEDQDKLLTWARLALEMAKAK